MGVAHKDILSHLDSSSCLVAAEQSRKAQDRHISDSAAALESVHSFDTTVKENSDIDREVLPSMSEVRVAEDSNTGAIKTQLLELQETQARISQEKREMSAVLVSIEAKIDALAGELATGNGNVGNRLQKIEALIGECKTMGTTSGQALVDIQVHFKEKLNSLEAVSKAIVPDFRRESTPLEWTIRCWSSLKEDARLDKTAYNVAENEAYFHGYCIRPGVRIETIDGVQWFRLIFCLHKGAYDHLLSWPMKESFSLKIVKATGDCFEKYIRADTSSTDLKAFRRPETWRTNYVIAPEKIELAEIEENGCVKDEKVCVRFQVN
ncbi:hypothetical protein HPB48_009107 [Haemaphysalis longicornis]|uniref:TRAF1-6 MATH domain-containing protein n=1 Tax=Haemaphysalis longicornis TaxID=44386 RepID=A0A9J6FLD1_HAELO|nr:hypothetical protein HPB48_009107 [Haemaphysalis longicornis]